MKISSVGRRLSYSGRGEFVPDAVIARFNPIKTTSTYFHDADRFDRRFSLTSSSAGVAGCLNRPDYFGKQMAQTKSTFIEQHQRIPTHSRTRVTTRPRSADPGAQPFTPQEIKQDIREVSANMKTSLDPVRRIVVSPRVRDTDTWRSQVFSHLPSYNELHNMPKNKGTPHHRNHFHRSYGSVDYLITHPREVAQNIALAHEDATPAPEAQYNPVEEPTPPAPEPVPETPAPAARAEQQPAPEMNGNGNGNGNGGEAQWVEHYGDPYWRRLHSVDGHSDRIYGVNRISPTKRRPHITYELPSLAHPVDKRKIYYEYGDELRAEIARKEQVKRGMKEQQPQDAFEFECYSRDPMMQRERFVVKDEQIQQMQDGRERQVTEKRTEREIETRQISDQHSQLQHDIASLKDLIAMKKERLRDNYHSQISGRELLAQEQQRKAMELREQIKVATQREKVLIQNQKLRKDSQMRELGKQQKQQMGTQEWRKDIPIKNPLARRSETSF